MKFDQPTPHLRWLVSPRTSIDPPVLQQWWISGLTTPDNFINVLHWQGEWREVPTAVGQTEEAHHAR